MTKISFRVRASGLIEVIVSMTIIIVIFGIAMMILTNVTGEARSVKMTRAKARLKFNLEKIISEGDTISRSYEAENIILHISCQTYNGDQRLFHYTASAFDRANKLFFKVERIVFKYDR